MQTEVPPLPIVYSEGDKHLTRRVRKGIVGDSPTESKNHVQCNNTIPFLVFNRKQLNPIIGGPYKDSMRVHCQSEPARVTAACKNFMGQRIISAKVLRMKELQNQLSDAHYHLNELANENRLLKALQKRQDSALKRYEGTNAELPRIINSHQEELKVLQTKYKQLKFQHKQTCDLLKEKESDIHSLQNQNKHLLKLSKDQHLGEREKLQTQVSDLNHEIQEQHKTIQMLNRKLTLQSKKFKHQINTEVTKHRDTRKQLNSTLEKLKSLEDLLNNREKRLYSNPNGHQLPSFNRKKPTTSQSLTNLRNNSGPSNFVKSSNDNQNSHGDFKNETLPKLNMKESNDTGKLSMMRTNNTLDIVNTSETMSSLDHVRKFRLQKSAKSRHTSPYGSDENDIKEKLEIETNSNINNCKTNLFSKSVFNKQTRDDEVISQEMLNEEVNDAMSNYGCITNKKEFHTPEKLMREFGFLSGNSDMSDDSHTEDEISPTSSSKYLHARLINTTTNGASSTDEETAHMGGSKKSRVSKKSAINEARESSVLLKDTEIRRNTMLMSRNDTNDDENILQPEFPRIDIEETSSYSSKKRQNISDIKKNIISRQNSINNSCDEFDTNNEESLKNGTDSWTRLRERLNSVQIKNIGSSQSTVDSIDRFSISKNNSTDNLESERKNSEATDELLHYFDIQRNNEEFSKLMISQDHNRHSGIPIANGSISNIENESMLKMSDEISEDNHSSKKDDEFSKNENDLIFGKEKIENTPNVQTAINKTRELSSSKQSETQEQTNYDKQKLLLAMKAIDDNENIEFIPEKKVREINNSIRSQVTENLYRGLPTHAKKRDDIIKDIFSDTKIGGKLHSGCSKLH